MFIKLEMSDVVLVAKAITEGAVYINLDNVYSIEAGGNTVEILFANGTMTTLRNGHAVQFLKALEAEGNVKGA